MPRIRSGGSENSDEIEDPRVNGRPCLRLTQEPGYPDRGGRGGASTRLIFTNTCNVRLSLRFYSNPDQPHMLTGAADIAPGGQYATYCMARHEPPQAAGACSRLRYRNCARVQ